MMRLVIDSLVAVMLAAVLAGVIIHNREQDEQMLAVETTRTSLRQIDRQLALRIALEQVDLTDTGHPRTIDPSWFQGELPRNMLLDAARPWMDIAGLEDRDRVHPLNIAATDGKVAAFWYNPYQGVVRARVPQALTDREMLDLYNRVNATKLESMTGQ